MIDPLLAALLGGMLIGLSAAVLLVLTGRIAGISGVVGGLMRPGRDAAAPDDKRWRLAFFVGLLVGGALLRVLYPAAFGGAVSRSMPALAVAGLLVGFGSRLGNGCTSGHGVCGVSRFSRRSIAATMTFIATAALTVWVVRAVFGGTL
ncbi:MAG: YeeE/YedE thiosulfate transporter family protein [Polyangiaceae bacterium]